MAKNMPTAPIFGTALHSPPIRASSRVCSRSCSEPASMNRAPVDSPWQIICTTAPWSASTLPEKMPTSTKPRWLTLV